jgi:hypothetical protein
VGSFRIGLHSLHSLHCFLLLKERGILIDHPNLVDAQPASSPCIIKTANLTIIKGQSQVRLMLGNPRGWGGTCGGPNLRPNRRPNYACCRNYNQTVALFLGLMRWVVAYRWSHRPITGTTINIKYLFLFINL